MLKITFQTFDFILKDIYAKTPFKLIKTLGFLTLHDTNLVELISGYLVPVTTSPLPFLAGWCRPKSQGDSKKRCSIKKYSPPEYSIFRGRILSFRYNQNKVIQIFSLMSFKRFLFENKKFKKRKSFYQYL